MNMNLPEAMQRIQRTFMCVSGALLVVSAPTLAQNQAAAPNAVESVIYRVKPQLTDAPHQLQIQMEIHLKQPLPHLLLQLPVWSPGDYHVQNFARYVQGVHAASNEAQTTITHPDANTWDVDTQGKNTITLTYTVSAMPPGLFSENVQLLTRQTFVNPAAALLYVVGYKDAPAQLQVDAPEEWRVESPLSRVDEKQARFMAPNYDTLADSPLLLAANNAVTVREFTLNNVPYRLAFFGRKERVDDFDAYVPVVKQLAQAETKLMGGAPFKNYEFFFDIDGRGGGLEHLNSCRIALRSQAECAPHGSLYRA